MVLCAWCLFFSICEWNYYFFSFSSDTTPPNENKKKNTTFYSSPSLAVETCGIFYTFRMLGIIHLLLLYITLLLLLCYFDCWPINRYYIYMYVCVSVCLKEKRKTNPAKQNKTYPGRIAATTQKNWSLNIFRTMPFYFIWNLTIYYISLLSDVLFVHKQISLWVLLIRSSSLFKTQNLSLSLWIL